MKYFYPFIILLLSCSILTDSNDEKDDPSFIKDSCPIWSPITNKIAYIHGGKITTPGVYLVNPDGSNNHILFSSIVVDHIIWAGEDEFMFDAYNQIWRYNYKTDSSFQITNTPGGNFFPSLDLSGEKLLYSKSLSFNNFKQGIWQIKINGSEDRFIVESGIQPSYLTNNQGFIYCGYPDDNSGEAEVYKYSFVDSSKIRLTNMKWNCRLPKISPDGKLIVFLHYENHLDYLDIYIMNSDGSNLRLLTKKGYYPSFSPNSDWVIYTNTNSKNGRIYKIKVDGSEKTALSPPVPDDYFK